MQSSVWWTTWRARTATVLGVAAAMALPVGPGSGVAADRGAPGLNPVTTPATGDEPGGELGGELGDVPLNTPVGALPNLQPNVNVTCAGAYPVFPVPGCTLFSPFAQAPRGTGALTTARVVAGPVTGPMRIVVLRAFRSQAGFPDQTPAPAGCCAIQAQSAVFTPTPNQATNLAVNLPMENRVIDIDGEPVEIVDYLGLAVLGPNIPVPFHQLASLDGVPLGVSGLGAVFPLGDVQPFGSFPLAGAPTISGVVCPNSRSGGASGIGLGVGDVAQNVCLGAPGGGGPGSPGSPGGSGSSEFVGITPSRLLDTRGGDTSDGEFSGGGKLQGGQEVVLDVAGRGDVPDSASAVVLNVTVNDPDDFGFITAYPCGIDRPNASNINFTPGQTVPNSVIVKIGDDGKVCLYSDQTTHLLADVGGYLPSSADYEALDPARFLDTRGAPTFDGRFSTGTRLQGGQEVELDVAGRGDVPSGADAVVLTVTVNGPDGPGFITVYPCGVDRPNASNLNYVAGQTIANTVVSKVGSNGKVCLFSDQTTHLLADVGGAFPSGSGFTSLDPARYLDTRGAPTFDGEFSTGTKLQGGQEIELDIAGRGDVPAGADAVVMNVTVNDPENFGFVTAYPCGVDRPTTSNLNYTPGQTIPNSVIVKVGSNGRVCLFSDQTTHLFADVSGYFD